MSLNDFMMKIPPQALLGLAGGLLQPGQSQGARFGAGMTGMNQGLLVAQLMEQRKAEMEHDAYKQQREREIMESLQRVNKTFRQNDYAEEALSTGVLPAGPDPTGEEEITWNQSRPVDYLSADREQYRLQHMRFKKPGKADLMNINPASVLGEQPVPELVNILDQESGRTFGATKSHAAALVNQFPTRYALAGQVSAGTDSAKEQEIDRLMTNFGLSRRDATAIADDVVGFSRDPYSGQTQPYNKLDLVGRNSGAAASPAAPPASPPGGKSPAPEFPPILGNVSEYGPGGFLAETAEKATFGYAGVDPKVLQTRQSYRVLRETLLDAYNRSGRPSNYAQQRVEELLPSTGPFESEARAWDSFKVLHGDLSSQLADDREVAGDEKLPVNMRQEASARIRSTERALRMIGNPADFPRPQSTAPSAAPPGIAPTTPSIVGPSGQRAYLKDGQWQVFRAEQQMWVPVQ